MKKLSRRFAFWFAIGSLAIISFHLAATPYYFSIDSLFSNAVLEWSNPMAWFTFFLLGGSYSGMLVFDFFWIFPEVVFHYRFTDFLPLYILHFVLYLTIGYMIDLIIRKWRS
ncbi:MAG: hypothetical protein ACYC5K_04430, partial [Saccharofermentanales bacterium]